MRVADIHKHSKLAWSGLLLLFGLSLVTVSCSEESSKLFVEPKIKDPKLFVEPKTKDPIPIPEQHYFYADIRHNPQLKNIKKIIDYVHYPTLGCPALLGPDKMLQVLVSLPDGAKEKKVEFSLFDRHQGGKTYLLQPQGDPETLLRLEKQPPHEARELLRYKFRLDNTPFALFDLIVFFDGQDEPETQHNAVRRYQEITGRERVIFCGDSQYYVHNHKCLKKFVEKLISWIWPGLPLSAMSVTTAAPAPGRV